ncbi:MAG: C-terminal helicase domain-containing protein [Desulfobacteraceae bacterium]
MKNSGGSSNLSHGLHPVRLEVKTGQSPGILTLNEIMDASKPVVLVLVDHWGCSEKSTIEAELMADLARAYMNHGISPGQMALISPHRAQNNTILHELEKRESVEKQGEEALSLPVIDTVERIQGAQRDIVIFGITSSDPDHMLGSFLNNPNRLNVSMTRAKKKLIIIGSRAFFSAIPDSEPMLEKNRCFKELLNHCRNHNAVVRPAGWAPPL